MVQQTTTANAFAIVNYFLLRIRIRQRRSVAHLSAIHSAPSTPHVNNEQGRQHRPLSLLALAAGCCHAMPFAALHCDPFNIDALALARMHDQGCNGPTFMPEGRI